MDYIAFIAGLPEMMREERRLPLTVAEFRMQLKDYIREKDERVLDLFFLPADHVQVLRLLRHEEADAGGQTVYPLALLAEEVAEPDGRIPVYLQEFITDFKEGRLEPGVLPENVLAGRYCDYMLRSGNRLVRRYTEFAMNLKNLVAALTARKHGRDVAREVVGSNEFAAALRSSAAKDFGLALDYPYVERVMALMEAGDLVERERGLDMMRWDFLDEAVLFEYFSFERVISYLLQLMILERWSRMAPESGRKVFMELVERFRQSFQFEEQFK